MQQGSVKEVVQDYEGVKAEENSERVSGWEGMRAGRGP